MSNLQEILTVIDLGSSTIVAAAGRLNEKQQLEVYGLVSKPSEGIRKGAIVNVEEVAQSIQQLVDKLGQQVGYEPRLVVSGVGGQQLKTSIRTIERTFDQPHHEISRKEVDEMGRSLRQQSLEADQVILQIIPAWYQVDQEEQVLNPVGMLGKTLRASYHLMSARELAVSNLQKAVERAGFELYQVLSIPDADAEMVLNSDEKEAGVALIHLGASSTSLMIYADKSLAHSAVIPFGGEIITNDIKEGCSVLQRQAEMLKVQFGSALAELSDENKVIAIPGISGRKPKEVSFRNLAHIIEARMEEILDAVLVEIEKSGAADKLSAGIVLSGGGSLLNHLAELVSIKSGFDVRLGYPESNVSRDLPEDLKNPAYTSLLGLLYQGALRAENLPPMESMKGKKGKKETKEKKVRNESESMFKGPLFSNITKKLSDLFEQ